MDKGRVIEEGDHDSLMHARGTYYSLIEQQNVRQDEDETHQEQNSSMKQDRASSVISLTPSTLMSIRGNKVKSTDTTKPNVIWTMMKMNKPEWLLILIGCVASICNGGLQPAAGIVLSKYISVCFE